MFLVLRPKLVNTVVLKQLQLAIPADLYLTRMRIPVLVVQIRCCWKQVVKLQQFICFPMKGNLFAEILIGVIATSWTHPSNGESFLLLFHESLYFSDRIPCTLLCPNQRRNYCVVVKDTPQQYNCLSKHSIKTDKVEIGLDMDGFISYFKSTKVTDAEIEISRRIILTSKATWKVDRYLPYLQARISRF
jgi:hypothetical protein